MIDLRRDLRGIRLVIAVALVATLFSFVKFNHCRATNWAGPDVDIHMCYSDLPALYGARAINNDVWPYSSASNSVEYPTITGLVMWGTGLLVKDPNGYRQYFDLNIFFIALLLIVAAITVWKIRPDFAFLYPLAPALIASLYINWDMWAVVPALLSILWFKEERYALSAIALSISISTKFFPIVFLLPISLIFFKRREIARLAKYIVIVIALWLAVNLPVALTYFEGWSRFYSMNIKRPTDLGSFWLALSIFGIHEPQLNNLTIVIFALVAIAITIFYFSIARVRDDFDNLLTICFLVMAAFVTISKVYSPQYILWLVPFAVIAMRSKAQRIGFWFWQGTEFLYHVAIWQYLAPSAGAQFGLPEKFYAASILLRILGLGYFCSVLIREARTSTAPREPISLSQ